MAAEQRYSCLRGCPSAPSRGSAVTHPAFFRRDSHGVQHRGHLRQAPEASVPRCEPSQLSRRCCLQTCSREPDLPAWLTGPLPTLLHPIRVSGLAWAHSPSVMLPCRGNADPWVDIWHQRWMLQQRVAKPNAQPKPRPRTIGSHVAPCLLGLEEPPTTPAVPSPSRAASSSPSVLVRLQGTLHRATPPPAGFLLRTHETLTGTGPALSRRGIFAVFIVHPRDYIFLYLRAQPLQS